MYVTGHALFSSTVISVSLTTSDHITVTEGEGVEIRLSAEAFGCYTHPIAIRVYCGAFTGGTTGISIGKVTISRTYMPPTAIYNLNFGSDSYSYKLYCMAESKWK